MGSTITNILLLAVSIVIGVGVAFFGTGLLNETGAVLIDQQMQIIVAVVLSLFAFIALYFMAKSRGGG
jgi:hypothetical protein